MESRAEDVALPLDTGGPVASLWRWIRFLEHAGRQLNIPRQWVVSDWLVAIADVTPDLTERTLVRGLFNPREPCAGYLRVAF